MERREYTRREYVIREPGDAAMALRDGKDAAGLTWEKFEEAAGVKGHTCYQWSHTNAPNLAKLLPALEAVGMEMVIRWKEGKGNVMADDTGVGGARRGNADSMRRSDPVHGA